MSKIKHFKLQKQMKMKTKKSGDQKSKELEKTYWMVLKMFALSKQFVRKASNLQHPELFLNLAVVLSLLRNLKMYTITNMYSDVVFSVWTVKNFRTSFPDGQVQNCISWSNGVLWSWFYDALYSSTVSERAITEITSIISSPGYCSLRPL